VCQMIQNQRPQKLTGSRNVGKSGESQEGLRKRDSPGLVFLADTERQEGLEISTQNGLVSDYGISRMSGREA